MLNIEHWDRRAERGENAGTDDVWAVKVEREQIYTTAVAVQPSSVLDVGCGVGDTLAGMAVERRLGVDFSPSMVDQARLRHPELEFARLDLMDPVWPDIGTFEMIYTERCLINLPDWHTQAEAIQRLCGLLAPGGVFLAVECSQLGLDNLNTYREGLNLHRIVRPWHNCYLVDSEVERLKVSGVTLQATRDFSSSYYLMSRVVNAWLAKNAGEEPKYDAPVNALGAMLAPIGDMGQVRAWLWERV